MRAPRDRARHGVPIAAERGPGARPTDKRYPGLDADRDLERQLAEGAPREGRLVARARPARRAPDAGDQARRRGRAGRRVPRRRLRARAPRRGPLERRRHRQPLRHRRTWSRTSASRCARRATDGRRRRRAARRGADDRGHLRRRPRRLRLRAQRPRRSARRSTRPSSPGSSGSRAGSTRRADPDEPLVLGGDFNVAPDGRRRVGPARLPRRHARLAAGARGVRAALRAGASSTPTGCTTPSPGRYTWWDYRAGNFHKNFGMRIDHLLVTRAARGARGRGRRSTARRARASRSPPTTRRS